MKRLAMMALLVMPGIVHASDLTALVTVAQQQKNDTKKVAKKAAHKWVREMNQRIYCFEHYNTDDSKGTKENIARGKKIYGLLTSGRTPDNFNRMRRNSQRRKDRKDKLDLFNNQIHG